MVILPAHDVMERVGAGIAPVAVQPESLIERERTEQADDAVTDIYTGVVGERLRFVDRDNRCRGALGREVIAGRIGERSRPTASAP
jgi:hypothetical protein